MNKIAMPKLENIHKYLDYLIYAVIVVIVLFLPYRGMYNSFKTFAVILFLLVLLRGQINLKDLIKNKVILALLGFILFTYASVFWTSCDITFIGECKANVNRFKYYFLIIAAIYSTALTQKQIKSIFFIMALAPMYTIVAYYLNALGVTEIKAAISYHGEDRFLTHYLINNFSILYGAIYFYVAFFDSLIKKDYKLSFVSLLFTIIYFVSMFVDELATSRLIILVFITIMFLVTLLYIKKKQVVFVLIILVGMSVLFISNSKGIQKGIETFSTAISEDKYTGSWGHRLGFAIVGLKIFEEHQIFGRGICDVRARTIEFAKENPKYFIGDIGRHFHNEHINLLVQVGVVGYLLFILFVVLFLRLSIQNVFLSRLKIAYVVSFLFIMFGEHYLTIGQTSSFFALFIALILLFQKQELLESKKTTEIQNSDIIKRKT